MTERILHCQTRIKFQILFQNRVIENIIIAELVQIQFKVKLNVINLIKPIFAINSAV